MNPVANCFKTVFSADGYHIIELDSYEDVWSFIETLREKSSDDYAFRGQSDASYLLEASLTRCIKEKEENVRRSLRLQHMRNALFEFRGRVGFQSELADCLDAVSKLKNMSISSSHGDTRTDPAATQIEAEFWAFGRHHGLATPLLDWTLSPGVALFFAIEREKSISRQMASFFAINQSLINKVRDSRGVSLDFVNPIRLANPRATAQRGLFTICSRDIPVEDWVSDAFKGKNDIPVLFKLIFPVTKRERRQCLLELRDRNITHSSVYPDVKGATDHANRLLMEEISKASKPEMESLRANKSQNADADIGLAEKRLALKFEKLANGASNNRTIVALSLLGEKEKLKENWEEWLVESIPNIDLSDQSLNWSYRAGCAYKLVKAGNKQQCYFLKTPDKRHFNRGSMTDISASFEKEYKNLTALNDEYHGGNDLLVAHVLASVDLKYSSQTAKELKLDLPESGSFPVLIHEFIPDKKALNVFLKNKKIALKPEQWLTLAHSLADTLRRVHNSSVLHAAIAHRHVLVSDDERSLKDAHLVGFGSSSLLSESGAINASFLRPKSPWLAPEVHEAEDLLGPLSFSTDIYSLGLVLLYAATHISPNGFDFEKNRHTNLLKKKITELLSRKIKFFDGAEIENPLSKRYDIAKIIDTCLRHEPSERYSCMEELVDAIDTAMNEGKDTTERELINSLSKIRGVTTKPKKYPDWKKLHPFFKKLLQKQVARINSDFIEKIRHGHYEVYGNRNTLINYLCNFMNLVEEGGIYRTVTLPGYWTDVNLGSDGRFLAKNKDLLYKNVTVERVFLVSGAFHTLPFSEQQVLLSHYNAWRELSDENRDRFKIRVYVEKSKTLMSFEKGGQAVAIIKLKDMPGNNPDQNQAISLRFLSTGKRYQYGGEYFIDRQITKLRFKVIAKECLEAEQEHMGFGVYFRQRGIGIDEFIHQTTTDKIFC